MLFIYFNFFFAIVLLLSKMVGARKLKKSNFRKIFFFKFISYFRIFFLIINVSVFALVLANAKSICLSAIEKCIWVLYYFMLLLLLLLLLRDLISIYLHDWWNKEKLKTLIYLILNGTQFTLLLICMAWFLLDLVWVVDRRVWEGWGLMYGHGFFIISNLSINGFFTLPSNVANIYGELVLNWRSNCMRCVWKIYCF